MSAALRLLPDGAQLPTETLRRVYEASALASKVRPCPFAPMHQPSPSLTTLPPVSPTFRFGDSQNSLDIETHRRFAMIVDAATQLHRLPAYEFEGTSRAEVRFGILSSTPV